MKVGAIIPAAGSGRRMGGRRKAFMLVAGKPMLQHSVETFLSRRDVQCVVVALAPEDVEEPPVWLRDTRIRLVRGGAHRADSVRAGLAELPDSVEAVVIHDAARPFVTSELIDRVLAEVRHDNSATVAIPVTDTIHEVDASSKIRATPARDRLWRAQTPQAFPREVLELAFASLPGVSQATDEAGLVASGGWHVSIVPGEGWNIKITTPDDLVLVDSALRQRKT